MRAFNCQDLLDLVDGAAIFSAGGGGDPEVGYEIADKLVSQDYTGKLAEKIEKDDKLAVLGLPSPRKWRTRKGVELWKDVFQRSNILEEYVPIEKLAFYTRR